LAASALLKNPWLRPFLWPLSVLYGLGVGLRNLAYDRQWLRSHQPPLPVLCVGNLNAGGSGKTPHTELITAYLQEVLGPVGILSRGYGRKGSAFRLATEHDGPTELGDEAYMLHAKLPTVPLAVCGDRLLGLQNLHRLHPELKAVVMDDGFQHRRVVPTLSMVLSDYSKPFFEDSLLPFGGLREPWAAYRRAQLVLFTKCPEGLRLYDRKHLHGRIADLPSERILCSCLRHLDPVFMEPFEQRPLNRDGHYLLVTGIANTELLCDHLNLQGLVYKHLEFQDHVVYTTSVLEAILEAFGGLKSRHKALITTEKDYVKLVARADFFVKHQIPLAYVPIEIYFPERDQTLLVKHLNDFVGLCNRT